MTKPREPGKFGAAITEIAAALGWDASAEIAGVRTRAFRNYSDDDTRQTPTLAQALALDAAYVASTGREPPLMAAYLLSLEIAATPKANAAEILRLTQDAAREAGEAVAALAAAAVPGAPHSALKAAVRESVEARDKFDEAAKKLSGGEP